MLQRIQTVYMLLVTALMSVMCFVPLARASVDGSELTLMAFDVVWVGILFALSATLSFVIIWLYKSRLTQIRLGAANIVLLLGAQGFVLYYALRFVGIDQALSGSVLTPCLFPIVCVVLQWLAIRATFKDEKLVRSLDRIR